MTNNLNVYIHAFLDNNLGDDLMIIGLLNEFKDCNFFTISQNSVIQNTFRKFNNLSFITKDEFKNQMGSYDVYLKIGGSMFQYNSIRQLVGKIRNLLILRKIHRKGIKLVALGCNLGPFKVRLSKFVARQELKLYDVVTVRDSYSYNFINEKFKLKNAELYDDIVFEVIKDEEPIIDENRSFRNRPILGISAFRSIDQPNINYDFYTRLVEEIKYLNEEYDFSKINLYAFDSENQNDLSACHHIKQLLQNSMDVSIDIIPYLGDNINQFLDRYKESDLMISIRFHSAILCDIYRIPYIPVAYSNKLKNYILDNRSHESVYDINELIKSKNTIKYDQFAHRINKVQEGHFIRLRSVFDSI